MKQTKDKPKLKLSDSDGNAFVVIGAARRALRRAGYSDEDIKRFTTEASSGDYDNVLQTCMKWCDVE